MPYFVKQGRADLPAHLCLAGADGLNVSLVKINPVRGAGGKDALFRARDAVKKAQEQSFALRFVGWQVFHDNRNIGELLAKNPGQAVQGLRNDGLELASLHLSEVRVSAAFNLPRKPLMTA